MLSILLVTCGLLGSPGPDQAAVKADLAAYEAAKAEVGRDADAHVKLALWCEAHGLAAERIKHLALATLSDPGNAAARGLLGLVHYQGKWQRPEDVSRRARDDPARQAILKEYLDRRARAADKPDDQWRLALWCDQNELKEQATFHLRRVVTLDPKRETAWKRLGFKKQGSQWVKPDAAAAEKSEFEAQRRASKAWKPKLERLGEALTARDKVKRAAAEKALGQITDPRAVSMVWTVFVRGDQARQRVAVQILGQINASGCSRALALLGVFSPWADTRQAAAAILRQRDPRDVAELLVGLLRDPIKYKVRSFDGSGSQAELLVEGKGANVRRLYTPLAPPPPMPGMQLVKDANGMLVANGILESYTSSEFDGAVVTSRIQDAITIPVGQMMADARNSALAAQQQFSRDVWSLEATNAQLAVTNNRLWDILRELSGQDFGQDQQAWEKWAVDLKGYALQSSTSTPTPLPTVVEQVPIDYLPQAAPPVIAETVSTQSAEVRIAHTCFGAGTQVRTLEGPRSIETIRAGDPVLTQNTTSGALSYQPVVVAYHNPPNAAYQIVLGNEKIVATGIHRFWKAGQGWVMTRELKPGDRLRTVGGSALVKAIEPDKVQPVFNLQLADGDSFFVGTQGVLAHDNSIVTPTEKPFDGVPVLGELPARPSF